MTRKAILCIFCLLFLVSCAGGVNANQASSPTTVTLARSTTTVLAISGGPNDTPTVTPTTNAQPTKSAQAKPTNTPAPSYHTCTAANCDNPWGFVLGCACGNMWQQVSVAPSGFCSWFHCIPNFSNENGTIGECGDGQFSHAGGLPGMCSGHGGLWGDLYVRVDPTPTPKPTATPTATPIVYPSPTPQPTAPTA